MPIWEPPTPTGDTALPPLATPGLDLSLEAEEVEVAQDENNKDSWSAAAVCILWMTLIGIYVLFLITVFSLSADLPNGRWVVFWCIVVVVPLALFIMGSWVLGCRKELAGWRVLLALVLSLLGGVIAIAVQYGAFLVFLITAGWLDDIDASETTAILVATAVLAVIFAVSGELVKVGIIAGASVDFDRSKKPVGYTALSAISSMAYVTFQSLQYACAVALFIPDWMTEFYFIAFRVVIGTMVDCFTGIIYGARMSKYSVKEAQTAGIDGGAPSSFPNFLRSIWLPVLIHLLYDFGIFFSLLMPLDTSNTHWLNFLYMPGVVALVAGILAAADALRMWTNVRRARNTATPVSYEMDLLQDEGLV